MNFPLTQSELNHVESIKKRFQNEQSISISGQDYQQWQDILNLMKERDFIRIVTFDGGRDCILTGDLNIFEKWLFDQQEKAKKLSRREWKISIVSAAIGAILGAIATKLCSLL